MSRNPDCRAAIGPDYEQRDCSGPVDWKVVYRRQDGDEVDTSPGCLDHVMAEAAYVARFMGNVRIERAEGRQVQMLDDVIAKLQSIRAEHGNLPCIADAVVPQIGGLIGGSDIYPEYTSEDFSAVVFVVTQTQFTTDKVFTERS